MKTFKYILKNFFRIDDHAETSLCVRYVYQPPPASELAELTSLWRRNEAFMMVRHPFHRLVSAYEVNN